MIQVMCWSDPLASPRSASPQSNCQLSLIGGALTVLILVVNRLLIRQGVGRQLSLV